MERFNIHFSLTSIAHREIDPCVVAIPLKYIGFSLCISYSPEARTVARIYYETEAKSEVMGYN